MSAKQRFIAREFGTPAPRKPQQWGVYDAEQGSWPMRVKGLGVIIHPAPSERVAQAEANRLSDHFGLPRPYP